jgi:hypothetical protein
MDRIGLQTFLCDVHRPGSEFRVLSCGGAAGSTVAGETVDGGSE